MSLRNIGIVYRKELTDSLRDRRTLVSMIVIPLLLFPVMMLGFSYLAVKLVGQAKKEVPQIMVLGGEDSPKVMAGLRNLDTIEIVPPAPDYVEQISNKKIRAAVEIPKGFDAALERNEKTTIKIYMYEGEIKSSFAADRWKKVFSEIREKTAPDRLEARKLPVSLLKPFDIEQKNVAPPEKVGGSLFGGLIGYMVIILCMTGAMYPAIDLTAGEKERGTMETILSSPISRMDLVMGKFFLVFSASLATAILSVISMGTSFAILGHTHLMNTSGGRTLAL